MYIEVNSKANKYFAILIDKGKGTIEADKSHGLLIKCIDY